LSQLSWSQWTTTPDASGNIYTNNSGNLGIGTTTPWSRLDIRTNGTAGTGYYGINLQNPSTAAWSTINLNLASGTSSHSIISSQQNNTGNGAYLSFQTTDGTGTMQTRMTLTDAGNVGIGTASPGRKLTLFTTASDDGISINHNGSGGIILHANSLPQGGWNGITQNGDAGIIYQSLTTPATVGFGFIIAPWQNATSGLRLDQNGNVGIGTSTTGSSKLAVEGTIAARKVVVTAANPWPDYVFDPTYALPSLDSVANYVRTNRHLSEIPSADCMAKTGLDLGGNQAALLRKIEELTLYAIAQKEQLESQAKEMNEKLAAQQQEIDALKAAVKKLLEK